MAYSREFVVALHSLYLNGTMYDDVRELAPYNFICPDFRGQGRRNLDEPAIIEELARDILAIIESIKEPVHLIGSSMGAYVGMIVAATAPQDWIRSCTFISCTADTEDRPDYFSEIGERIRRADPLYRAEVISSLMFGKKFRRSGGERYERWRKWFKDLAPSVYRSAELMFSREGLWNYLERIRSPIYLFGGAEDSAKPPKHVYKIQEFLGDAELTIIDEVGHTPVVECPKVMAEHLIRIISKNAA